MVCFSSPLNPIRRIKELAQELRRALEQRDQALQDKQRLENENARLREEIERLQKELEAAQRAVRRQAAPFSRGQRKSHPKSPLRTWVRRFDIPICRCTKCGKRVQGRHPLQTSD